MKMLLKIILIMAFSFLCACSADEPKENVAAKMQSEAAHFTLLNKKILAYQVKIYRSDDAMLFLLPIKRFFNPGSANFTHDAYFCLDDIIELLQRYDTAVVKVSGYAAYCDCSELGKAMAEARAHKVAKYLWDKGIDASFIYAEGHDATAIRKGKCVLSDYVVVSMRLVKMCGISFSKIYK